MDRRRERGLAIVAIIAIAGLGAWTFTHLEVTTEITHFLPETDDAELARIAQEMSRSDLNRSVTLLVHAADEATTIAASRDLTERLTALDEVAWARRGPGPDMNEAFYSLYCWVTRPSQPRCSAGASRRATAGRLWSPTTGF